jgi:hypothetical protein
MSKHRRFSWEDSIASLDMTAIDGDEGRLSPEHDASGNVHEQSTERNTEQSNEQCIPSTANDTHVHDVFKESLQIRKEAQATASSSSEATMFAHPPMPTGSVLRTNRQPSPLTHGSYKRDGWVVPDESVAPVGSERKLRFDSAVEKNNGGLVHSTDTSGGCPDTLAYTAGLSPALKKVTNTAVESPGNNPELLKDLPPVPPQAISPERLPTTWYCCTCGDTHAILLRAKGPHPIGRLGCECSHRPCEDCEFSGYVKMYCPVDEEPALVHMSEDKDDAIKFGVICSECGLSWRAQLVKKEMSKMRSALHKISGLPKKLNRSRSLQKLRQASASMVNLSRPEHSLSKTRSFGNLRSVSETKKMVETSTKEVGGQANSAKVRFFGIMCVCGHITESESVCFQITEVPWGSPEADLERTKAEIRQRVGITSPPELQQKGHRDRFISLKGGEHPNPLLSSPVDEYWWRK